LSSLSILSELLLVAGFCVLMAGFRLLVTLNPEVQLTSLHLNDIGHLHDIFFERGDLLATLNHGLDLAFHLLPKQLAFLLDLSKLCAVHLPFFLCLCLFLLQFLDHLVLESELSLHELHLIPVFGVIAGE